MSRDFFCYLELVDSIRRFLDEGSGDRGVELLREAADLLPWLADADLPVERTFDLFNLGMRLGEPKVAFEVAQRLLLLAAAAKGEPYRDRAFFAAGAAAQSLHRFEEAIAHFKSGLAVAAQGSSLEFYLHSNLGLAYKESGQPNAALVEYRAAERVAPHDDPAGATALAVNLAMLLPHEQAVIKLKQALESAPRDMRPGIAANLANALRDAGQTGEAEVHYRIALDEARPDDAALRGQILSNLATLRLKQGNHAEAIALYGQALELRRRAGDAPGEAKSLHWLARAHMIANQPAQAMASSQEAVQIWARLRHPDLADELEFLSRARAAAALTTPDAQALQSLLRELLAQTEVPAIRAFVEQHPELCSEAIDPVVTGYLELAEDPDDKQMLLQRWALLRECRDKGVEEGFATFFTATTIQELLVALVKATSLKSKRELIVRHETVFVSARARELLMAWMDDANAKENAEHVRMLQGHLRLLERCAELGIDQVLIDKTQDDERQARIEHGVITLLNTSHWLPRKRLVQANAELLTSEAAFGVLEALRSQYADELEHLPGIESLEALLKDCVERGVSRAFAEQEGSLVELLLRVHQVGTWEESRELLECHYEAMLSAHADAAFNELERLFAEHPLELHRLKEHRRLIDECRLVGIDGAFATRQGLKFFSCDIPLRSGEHPEEAIDAAGRLLGGLMQSSILTRHGNERIASVEGDRQENLRHAIKDFEQALALITPATARSYVNASHGLGAAHAELSEKDLGQRDAHLRQAIASFQAALEYGSPSGTPRTCRENARALCQAILRLDDARDREAHELSIVRACADAMRATDELVRAGDLADAGQEFYEGAWAYPLAMETAFDRGEYGAAWEALERGKARSFVAAMVQETRSFPQSIPPALIDEEVRLRAALEQARREGADTGSAELDRRLESLGVSLDAVHDRMGEFAPDFADYRRGRPITGATIGQFLESLPPAGVVLQWSVSGERVFLFIGSTGSAQIAVQELEVTVDELARHSELARHEFWTPPRGDESISSAWMDLGDRLVPVSIQRSIPMLLHVILVSHWAFSGIPIHALPLTRLDGQSLSLTLPVTYLPSLSIGRMLSSRRNEGTRTVALAFGGNDASDPHAVALGQAVFDREATAVLSDFPDSVRLAGQEATADALVSACTTARLVHLACHGIHDADSLERTGVYLAAKSDPQRAELFSALDLIRTLRLPGSLVFMSACETAQSSVEQLDEQEGLVRSLFVAGAGAVVGTQAQVALLETTTFVIGFYSAMRQGKSLGESMHAAARLTATSAQTAHPYFWAPFVGYGLK